MKTQMEYKPKAFENKWINYWEKHNVYMAKDSDSKRQKKYILIEFPYPSGERLHTGHARSYCSLDAVARLRRMKGDNVLFPFGWDAFGLPAENYAIKTGISPFLTTKTNIENAKKQVKSWGLSFDWEREINTTDSNYYKWTQWIFVQMFKKGLAYKQEIAVNWCPSCKTNLANEEVVDNKCERCGTNTERRLQSQWLLAITQYADRLLHDLESVNYRNDIKQQQVNWIGKKEGVNIQFKINKLELPLDIFTTRIDTLYGVTFIVIAPEHKLIDTLSANNSNFKKYVKKLLNKSERERKISGEKNGIDTGWLAINPANGNEIPIWVSDYVVMDVGTGAVMGVPGHDKRDYEFAVKNNLPIIHVVEPTNKEEQLGCFENQGVLINSGKYTGLNSQDATEAMVKDGLGVKTFHYHLRDWIFSRQHYWGEPIPMVFCEKCGWKPVPENELPVELPKLERFAPSETGQSPLALAVDWVNTTCPECGGKAKRETDTMPNWAGSSWYYLRYCDPNCDTKIANSEKLNYWLPVDWYNGGMEHTTLHLLYSRFWHKFLYDIGEVPTIEPYLKRTSHGVVLGTDGRKMSKSRGNVINPDIIVEKFGADTLRMYEMFIGPFDQTVVWNDAAVEGVYRFLRRVYTAVVKVKESKTVSSDEGVGRMAALAEKIENDLETMKFNTVVSALMEFVNWWEDHLDELGHDQVMNLIKVMAPVAPFLAEELNWMMSGEPEDYKSIHLSSWPKYSVSGWQGKKVVIPVQVNGKLRVTLEIETEKSMEKDVVEKKALEDTRVQAALGANGYRVVFLPGKLINLVSNNEPK